mmetsp:Transcript_38331/g.114768  ORF Transcript_38331/g.114768 Transcript_38331/m.114768 type:complete len:260 (-) Transcript_38331:142-921(-)
MSVRLGVFLLILFEGVEIGRERRERHGEILLLLLETEGGDERYHFVHFVSTHLDGGEHGDGAVGADGVGFFGHAGAGASHPGAGSGGETESEVTGAAGPSAQRQSAGGGKTQFRSQSRVGQVRHGDEGTADPSQSSPPSSQSSAHSAGGAGGGVRQQGEMLRHDARKDRSGRYGAGGRRRTFRSDDGRGVGRRRRFSGADAAVSAGLLVGDELLLLVGRHGFSFKNKVSRKRWCSSRLSLSGLGSIDEEAECALRPSRS